MNTNLRNEAKNIMKDARGFACRKAYNNLTLISAIKAEATTSIIKYIFWLAPDIKYTVEEKEKAQEIVRETNKYIKEKVQESVYNAEELADAFKDVMRSGEKISILESEEEEPQVEETISQEKFFDDDKGTNAERINNHPDFRYIYGGCYLCLSTGMIGAIYQKRHDKLFHIGYCEHDKNNWEVYADNNFKGTIAKNWSHFTPNGDSNSNYILTGIQRSMEKVAAEEMQKDKHGTAAPDPFFP